MTERVQLQIEGITCAHCAKGIEEHLHELGLPDARVEFSSKTASFSSQPKLLLTEILNSLNKIGYKAQPLGEKQFRLSLLESLPHLALFCSVLSIPLIFSHFIHIELLHDPIIQLALTIPVMLTGGMYFTRSALRSFRLKKPNMDVLIAIGTWAAFIYSFVGTLLNLGPDFLFYETSASIVSIVLLGNLLEHRAVRRTEDSLTRLQQLQPDTIRIRKLKSDQVISIGIGQICEGDSVVLSPGDRVPTDGVVIEGAAELDQSFLTGEHFPRSVQISDTIESGALVVGGNLVVKAIAIGEQSSLVKIIRSIQEARSAKPELERLADRLTHYFVPIVLGLSVLTFVLNLAFGISATDGLLRAIAVLVVSCPCALGLATPTAVTVSLGLASRMGILVRKAATFEALAILKYYFFDKTGTLTDGQFVIERFESLENDSLKMKQILLGLEAFSHHPIAVALRKYCLADGTVDAKILSEVDERRGLGVFGKTPAGKQYELSSRDVSLPFHLALRENDQIIGKIQLSDSIKPEAAKVIAWLKENNISTEILSGDNKERTEQIASALSIPISHAQLLPQQKADRISEKENELKVAFVGDGINDAAALARASVGITFGTASDLARHSADVTIVSGNLERIPHLIELSQRTISLIKQNLFWAFFYNILCIPLAAFGLLSPMHAAFAMVLSDIIVVANSLRLKLWHPKKL